MREKLPILLLAFVIALTLSACAKLENTNEMKNPSSASNPAAAIPIKIINQITNGNTRPLFKDKLNKQELEPLADWLSSKT